MSSAPPGACRGTPRSARALFFALVHVSVTTAVVATEESTKAACKHTTDCEGENNYECIDNRCICNPLWAHTGPNCDEITWTSWALVVVLAFVSVFSVTVLASAAKKLSATSSKCGSGFAELARMFCRRHQEEDSGSTTIRFVMLSVVFNISSYVWKILTAIGVTSHSTSAYWDARLFMPLTEGMLVLPVAIVVSVWMDVAKSSLSRSKSKKNMKRTKKVLQLGTVAYVALLILLCLGDKHDLAMVAQLGAIGLGLTACGSGAAKLCNTLRALSESSASIADKVFKVSRSMGISLYVMFIGDTMLLSSRTRKSDPANLALVGMAVSSLAKCFLNKAIFEYMVESTCAKNARLASRMTPNMMPLSALKPLIHVVESVRSLRQQVTAKKIAIDELDRSISAVSASTTNLRPLSSILPESVAELKDEDKTIPDEEKTDRFEAEITPPEKDTLKTEITLLPSGDGVDTLS